MEWQQAPVHPPYLQDLQKTLMPPLLAGGMFFILCLIHWFAWSNFRRLRPSAGRIVLQLVVALFALGLIVLAIALALLALLPWH